MIKLSSIRKWNFPLIIGGILLFVLLITSMYPEKLATADPYGKQRLEFQVDGGKTTFVVPPVPPGDEYPWGTDHRGRDLRSLIIYGCKITMITAILTAIGRLIIALPLAIAGAYKNKFATWFIKQFNILFSAFPLIVVVLMLSNFALFIDILKKDNFIVVLLLTLFGWSKLAYVLMEKVSEILEQDFVEGEIAIGKSRLEIAVQNVIPHLIPSLIVFFFLEIALVLQTMSQIGIFGLLAAGGYYNADGDLNVPFEFDWASLLIFTYMFFGTDKIYLIIYPAAAFAASIVGFNLFGEGLRIEFEKRTSRVITFIRRIPSYVSPLKLAYEIKNYEQHKKTVIIKLACYTLVLGIIFFPQPPSLYKFDSAEAFNTIEEISGDKYKGRLAGSEENKALAEYISSELESYGVKPYDNKYIHEFDILKSVNVKASTLKLKDSFGRNKELIFRKDYAVASPVTFSGEFEVEKVEVRDLIELNSERVDLLMARGLHSKVLILDLSVPMDYRHMTGALQTLAIIIKPRALLVIQDWGFEYDAPKHATIDKLFQDTVVISMSKEAGEELLRLGEPTIEFSVESETIANTKGYNVLGYIPGTDPEYKDDFIVIGSRIDYVGDDKAVRYPGTLEAGSVAAQLEIAKKLAQSEIKPKQNIMFAFWDGTFNDKRGSSSFVSKYALSGKIKSITYFNIGNIAIKEDSKVLLDTSRIFPKNKEAQEYIQILKDNARAQNIDLQYGNLNTPVLIDMTSRNIQSLMVSNPEKEPISTTMRDNMDMLDKKQYKKIGQMLLDTIVDIARGK
ncbi:MAG: binding-protein-dependent transport system inner rane component [Clostridia bacterium]|nr:binding-protein-dependent transport system inner rane component [Clostridia bacterium]